MDLKKAKYILPNLFTLSSVFAGFYAMVITSRAVNAQELSMAVWMLGLSMILDALDGRVARATNTQSEFGVQLDSLADAIAFGIAPAFLAYKWGLESLGGLGLFIAFSYAACGIIRLARFNVEAAESSGSGTHFTGLPIPLAAGALLSVILAHLSMTGNMQTASTWSVALTVAGLGGLMVSTVKYRTFKKLKMGRRTAAMVFLLLGGITLVSVRFNPGLAFAAVLSAYILVGIAEALLGRHRAVEEEDEALKLKDPR